MKGKNIIIIIIILIIAAIIGLTLFKFKGEKTDVNNSNNDNIVFTTYEITENKKDYNWSETKDSELYSDYIITEDLKSVEYEFFDEAKSLIGEIYIDDNGFLHITESNDKDDKIVTNNVKFRTMHIREGIKSSGMIWIYLITVDNELAYFTLYDNSIEKISLDLISTVHPVTNFTSLSYDNDMDPSGNTFFVLEDDGNIYEIYSGYRYIPNTKLLFDSIIVFDDKTVANAYGNMLRDKDGKIHKIKYIFNTSSKNELFGPNAKIIITEDNTLITSTDSRYLNIANSKVKTIKFDGKYPFVGAKLYINLENTAEFNFDAMCSAYYCINELDV